MPYGVAPLEAFVYATEKLEPSTAHSELLRETLPFVEGSKSLLVLVDGMKRLLAGGGLQQTGRHVYKALLRSRVVFAGLGRVPLRPAAARGGHAAAAPGA